MVLAVSYEEGGGRRYEEWMDTGIYMRVMNRGEVMLYGGFGVG